MTKTNEEIVKEARLAFYRRHANQIYPKRLVNILDSFEVEFKQAIVTQQQTHQQEMQKARAEAWQEAVDLADKIELREPDGGTKQWMAFKAFRNTLRDKIKNQPNN